MASDDAFGSDGAGHPIFSCGRVIPKGGDEEWTNGKCDGNLIEWSYSKTSAKNILSGAHK